MSELKHMNKLVRKWRARAEDCGPAARAYLDAANDLESEINKSAQLVVAVDGAGPSNIEALRHSIQDEDDETQSANDRAATEL